MSAPLMARGRVLGAITLLCSGSAPVRAKPTSSTAEELARRAASRSRTRCSTGGERRAARPACWTRRRRRLPARSRRDRPALEPGGRGDHGPAADEVVGRPASRRSPAGRRSPPRPRRDDAGTARVPRRCRSSWAGASSGSRSRRRFAEGTVYAFRDLTEERALEELRSRFRLHRLARAADAARRDLRRRADPPARRLQLDESRGEPARRDRERVRPARPDRERHPLGEPARRGEAAGLDRVAATRRLARTVIERRGRTCRRRRALAPCGRPAPVAADPDKVRQVLTNLSTTRSSTRPTAARSRSRSRAATSRPLHRRATRGSASRPPSSGGSSRSSTASTRSSRAAWAAPGSGSTSAASSSAG